MIGRDVPYSPAFGMGFSLDRTAIAFVLRVRELAVPIDHPQEVIAWNERDPTVWIHESIALRKTIYPTNPALSWDYAYQHRTEVDDRLKRAGVRIAAYLNWIFDGTPTANAAAKR